MRNFPPKADFLTHFTEKSRPSIFKWSALSMRSADWNAWDLTKSGLSFLHKMIQEIISMTRVDSGYPYNSIAQFMGFQGWRVRNWYQNQQQTLNVSTLVGSQLLAWRIHAQSPLLAHYVHTHKHTQQKNGKKCHMGNQKSRSKCKNIEILRRVVLFCAQPPSPGALLPLFGTVYKCIKRPTIQLFVSVKRMQFVSKLGIF